MHGDFRIREAVLQYFEVSLIIFGFLGDFPLFH